MEHRTAAVAAPGLAGALAAVLLAPPTASAAPLPPECAASEHQVRCLFTQPAAIATVFRVPAGVVNLAVSARGGSGGPGDADQSSDCTDGALSLPRAGSVPGAPGGLGGTAGALLNVEPGQVLDLYAGGMGASANGITGGSGGLNGGAPGGTVRLDPGTDVCDPFNQFGGGGGGGGGGSFVMAHGTLPQVALPLLAAGGGGGGGGTYGGVPGGSGGAGGGEAGDDGTGGENRGLGGSTQGGPGGPAADHGSRGSGGLGAPTLSAPGAGGGGGGGFFGGGGGGSSVPAESLAGPADLAVISGGGGGGSGFVAGAGPGVRLSKAALGAGSVSGPGEIAISYRSARSVGGEVVAHARVGDQVARARRIRLQLAP